MKKYTFCLNIYIYIFFFFFFTSSSPFAVMISLPFHDFLQAVIILIQVYSWEIRHHSLVCRCGLAGFLYFGTKQTKGKIMLRIRLGFNY